MTDVTVTITKSSVTADVLNQNFKIESIIDNSTYTIRLPVYINESSTKFGGTAVTASYEIPVGINTQVGGFGWGAGTWGRNTWGSAADESVNINIRVWSQDTFGQDLVATLRDGEIYYWSASVGKGQRAYSLSSKSTDSTTPTKVVKCLVSDRDRHLIAFGSNMGGATQQDKMLIRFSDQEDPYTWYSTANNTAGDLRLGIGSEIVTALETKREILVWTDSAMYSMQYIGPPYTYGVVQLATGINIVGINAAAAVDELVVWMGSNSFYIYAGQTEELPCSVKLHVFNDFNMDQKDKVYAGVNTEFNEITWFYPSASSTENDRYVSYDYSAKIWNYGVLARTAYISPVNKAYPIAAGTDNYLYNQEYGTDDGSTNPVSPLDSYIESSPINIGNGESFMMIDRILPDVNFANSTGSPEVSLILKTQNFPGSNYNETSNSAVDQTAVVPVQQWTEQSFVRMRGRQVQFRLESNKVGTRWILGSTRINVRQDGRR